MIHINLLPTELRIVEVKSKRFPVQPILIGILFIFLFASLIQFFSFMSVRKKLRDLNAEMTKLHEPSEEASKLDMVINGSLMPEKYFLDQYVVPNFLMAEVMNVVSDLLPEGTWLSDLSIKRDREAIRMDLIGYSRITYQQIAAAQIQEYVNAVKAKIEEVFGRSQLELKPEVKAVLTTNLRRDVSGMDAMQFSVSFQSVPALATKKN